MALRAPHEYQLDTIGENLLYEGKQTNLAKAFNVFNYAFRIADNIVAIASTAGAKSFSVVFAEGQAKVIEVPIGMRSTELIDELRERTMRALMKLAEEVDQVEEIYLAAHSEGLIVSIIFSSYDFDAEQKFYEQLSKLQAEFLPLEIFVDTYYADDFEEEDVEGLSRIYAKAS